MGLLGLAVAGGLQGAGEGVAAQGTAWTKEQIDAEKEKVAQMGRENVLRIMHTNALDLQEQNSKREMANLPEKTRIATDEAIRKEKESPRVVAEGSTLRAPGQPDFTPPKTEAPKSQELLDYYAANAKRLNAEADAISEGMKYRDRSGKTEKTLLPKYKTEKDADGNPYMVEEITGAIGRIIPGQPATPEKHNWFSANDPAKKAGAPKIEWSMPDGTPLPDGPSSLFPGAPGAGRSSGGGGAPQGGAGVPSAAIEALKANPERAEDFKRKYGVDPTQYLPKKSAPQGAQQPAARTGYADALDAVAPKKPRGLLNTVSDDDRMMYP